MVFVFKSYLKKGTNAERFHNKVKTSVLELEEGRKFSEKKTLIITLIRQDLVF